MVESEGVFIGGLRNLHQLISIHGFHSFSLFFTSGFLTTLSTLIDFYIKHWIRSCFSLNKCFKQFFIFNFSPCFF